jgi:hypothetical protein
MSSNNVIQFPGGQEKERQEASREVRPTAAPASGASPLKRVLSNKSFLSVLILGLCVFAFNFKFSGPPSQDALSQNEGRGVASVKSISNGLDVELEKELARRLASTTPLSGLTEGLGRSPSSDDRVRHGVLSSRGYIFKRDIAQGYLMSIQLQADEDRPAYLLHPEEFIEDYGRWFNEDFSSVQALSQGEDANHLVNHYLLLTHSGKKFEITVERDQFQRLTSLFQTEVADNSY